MNKKLKRKKIKPITTDEDGNKVFNLAADAANDDWIRAARLQRKADAGDEEAQKKLDKLKNTDMIEIEEDEEDEEDEQQKK